MRRYDPDMTSFAQGEWVRFEDAQEELDTHLKVHLEVVKENERLRDELTAAHLERDALKRSEYGPPADHCEKHGSHRAFADGCPECYHEKHDLPRTAENAK